MIWPRRKVTAAPALPPVHLDGLRVTLRPPRPDDYLVWKDVRGRNREHLKPFEPTWPEDCLSPEFFERRLLKQTREWRTGTGYAFLIFSKNDVLLGGININHVCRGAAQQGTLGYWLDEGAQGRGLMTEALALVIDYGFDELNLHRFHAGCLPHNERSVRLLLRLGFSEEGYARSYVKIDGQWQDHRLFGLPVEERRSFEKQHADPGHRA